MKLSAAWSTLIATIVAVRETVARHHSGLQPRRTIQHITAHDSSTEATLDTSPILLPKVPQLLAAKTNEVTDANNERLLPIYPPRSSRIDDALWEKLTIFLLSWSLANVSVDKYNAMKYVYPGMGYPQFVSVTRTLLQGSAADIKKRILDVLLSVFTVRLRRPITEYIEDKPKWISEKSSEFMSFGLLGWLVGPVDRYLVDVPQPDGSVEQWLSGAKITECRYLVESGCKSACLHLCKGPTQSFFNEELGIKLHMKPDFSDCSCEMIFGVAPPAADVDPAYGEPCFSTCSTISAKKKSKRNPDEADANFNKCS